MYQKILSFMEKHHMIEKGDCILAAVSGGADSICLLEILKRYQEHMEFTLGVVHVEHGIRGKESQNDAEFVEHYCKTHGIPCVVYHCKAAEYARTHKMTVEEGARKLRYEYFAQGARKLGADKIAVAHNQNDCAETMLFHLARGTGLRGLGGIQPVREKIIRPLLCVERKEIEAYLEGQNQKFCTDSTNEELNYTRNKIRHQVLPVLETINNQAVFHMNQMAEMALEAVDLLEELTKKSMEQYVVRDAMNMNISDSIIQEKPILQKSLLHAALAQTAGNSKDISAVHVQNVKELFEKQVGKQLSLPYGIEAERTYQGVCLRKKKREIVSIKEDNSQIWELEPEQELQICEYGYCIHTKIVENIVQIEEIPKKRYTKWFDYDRIKGSMQLRTRKEQDYFIINADGAKKKLKNYFIDEKVPKHEREKMLLFVDDTHIIWAIGYRISEDVKVTQDTKRILEIQVDGGKICE
ncbi:MAG: tRNA lysidine(34) synthetase TilS [Lachnospiraceae bacterium]